jgi:hypothetical protein
VLFSLYIKEMSVPSPKPSLLVSYLESYLSDIERWLGELRFATNLSKSNAMLFAKVVWRVPKPRPVQFLGEPIQWVDTARYLGGNLDSRLTWSPPIVHVRKKAAKRLGILLNRRSGLSTRNRVLLYKQLIGPMMEYACPIWRSVASSHVRKLQILQFMCLCNATDTPCHISNRQIHGILEFRPLPSTSEI